MNDNLFTKKVKRLDEDYNEKLTKFVESSERSNEAEGNDFINMVILIKKLATIPFLGKSANANIQVELKLINKHSKIIQQVYIGLMNHDNCYAGRILEEFPVFNKMKGLKYQEETKKTNSGEYILN